MGGLPRDLAYVFAVLALSASTASSCTCFPKPSVEEALSQSTAVFVGRVMTWRYAKTEVSPGINASAYSYVFEVKRLYKGALSSEVALLTGNGHADCGYPFEVGEEYLVYAYGNKVLGTNVCTRTTRISRADKDLAKLGVPRTIFLQVSTVPLMTVISITVFAFLAGIVVGRKWLPKPSGKKYGQ
jgi:hypothetical protein